MQARSLFGAVAVVVALAATPWLLAAQAIRGVVLDDETGRPVGDARVRLFSDDELLRGMESDSLGRFLLPVPGEGRYALEVERLGYRTARSSAFPVELGDTLAVEFRVLPDAVLLEPMLVTGRSILGRHLFYKRQEEWGEGIFRGPEVIDSIDPSYVGDIFRDMEKVQLRWGYTKLSSGSWGVVPKLRTYLGRGCLLYMVDRVPVRPEPWVLDDWGGYQLSGLDPDDVMAVEVYRYVGEAPPELRRYASQTRTVFGATGIGRQERDLCGLAVIWTRAGW